MIHAGQWDQGFDFNEPDIDGTRYLWPSRRRPPSQNTACRMFDDCGARNRPTKPCIPQRPRPRGRLYIPAPRHRHVPAHPPASPPPPRPPGDALPAAAASAVRQRRSLPREPRHGRPGHRALSLRHGACAATADVRAVSQRGSAGTGAARTSTPPRRDARSARPAACACSASTRGGISRAGRARARQGRRAALGA